MLENLLVALGFVGRSMHDMLIPLVVAPMIAILLAMLAWVIIQGRKDGWRIADAEEAINESSKTRMLGILASMMLLFFAWMIFVLYSSRDFDDCTSVPSSITYTWEGATYREQGEKRFCRTRAIGSHEWGPYNAPNGEKVG